LTDGSVKGFAYGEADSLAFGADEGYCSLSNAFLSFVFLFCLGQNRRYLLCFCSFVCLFLSRTGKLEKQTVWLLEQMKAIVV
jgi:hypothetical protein